jgi:hypothetical protein
MEKYRDLANDQDLELAFATALISTIVKTTARITTGASDPD